MKVTLLFLAAAIAVSYAQFNLVAHEVHAIIEADKEITADECTKKCDDVFGLVDPKDEKVNDHQCAYHCECQINHICQHPTFATTTAGN